MNKDLIILRGVSGSGKSTVALLFDTKAICCADDYHVKNGEYKWDVNNLKKAHEWCQRKCVKHMKRNTSKIVIANTNTKESEMKPYLEYAEKYGYRVFTLIVENRHGNKNVHNVPESIVNKMSDNLKSNIKL